MVNLELLGNQDCKDRTADQVMMEIQAEMETLEHPVLGAYQEHQARLVVMDLMVRTVAMV